MSNPFEILGIHIDLWKDTILNITWWRNKTWTILTKPQNRFYLWSLIFILNIIGFLVTPQKHSNKTVWKIPYWSPKYKWSFHHISHHTKNKIIGFIIILIDVVFFYYLYHKTSILQVLPKQIWIGIAVLGLIAINAISNNKQPILKDETFNPPPAYIVPKKKRVVLYIIIVILHLTQFITEFKLSYIPEIFLSQTGITKYIYSRFGGFNKTMLLQDKLLFGFGWSRLLGLLIQIIGLYSAITFFVCKYNLPLSWEY